MVEVNDASVKRKFQARTDLSWQDFAEMAYDCFRKPRNEVLMGYKFIGDAGGVTELTSEKEWNNGMIRIKEKIKSARTRSVTMELRNMVSDVGALDHKGTDLFRFAARRCKGNKSIHERKGQAHKVRRCPS